MLDLVLELLILELQVGCHILSLRVLHLELFFQDFKLPPLLVQHLSHPLILGQQFRFLPHRRLYLVLHFRNHF
jgi:hypothetical protein